MGDLENPKLIYAKGFLFLLLGLIFSAMILVMFPSLAVAVLLAITVWSSCRFYYLLFTSCNIMLTINSSSRAFGILGFCKIHSGRKKSGKRTNG